MRDNSFEEKVRRLNWTKYLKPEYCNPEEMDYSPEKLIKVLVQLSQYDGLNYESVIGIGSEVRFAIGNDHRGTYYPAALEAIDLIIEIEKHSDLEAARNCATAILNDLYYFRLELGSNDERLYDSIESIIRKKLQSYSDEAYLALIR